MASPAALSEVLRSEEVVAVGDGWGSMAWALNGKDGSDYAIAKPKEKASFWTHDWIIRALVVCARGAEESVYSFMNWSLSAEQAALMGRKVGYVSPSTAGMPLLSPEESKRIGYDSYQEISGGWHADVGVARRI